MVCWITIEDNYKNKFPCASTRLCVSVCARTRAADFTFRRDFRSFFGILILDAIRAVPVGRARLAFKNKLKKVEEENNKQQQGQWLWLSW